MKWIAQLCPTLCNPMDYIVQGILQARMLEWVAFPFSRGYSQLGIKPRSPTLQADSLPAESQGKPKNTRVGSLSLLQWIFLSHESNRGLLHCRQILYQLSYEGRIQRTNSRQWCHFFSNFKIIKWKIIETTKYKDKISVLCFLSDHSSIKFKYKK